jgi:hypothetical protein
MRTVSRAPASIAGGTPGRCRTARNAPQNRKKSEEQTTRVRVECLQAKQARPLRSGRVQRKSETWKWTNRASRMPEDMAKSGVTNLFLTGLHRGAIE